jgi:hypothetical protein
MPFVSTSRMLVVCQRSVGTARTQSMTSASQRPKPVALAVQPSRVGIDADVGRPRRSGAEIVDALWFGSW